MTKEEKEQRQAFEDECHGLYLQIWRTLNNLYKGDYNVTATTEDGEFTIEVMPARRDYITNCILEEFNAIRKNFETYGYGTYHIDVKPFLIETTYGHMVTTYAPRFLFKQYQRNK